MGKKVQFHFGLIPQITAYFSGLWFITYLSPGNLQIIPEELWQYDIKV